MNNFLCQKLLAYVVNLLLLFIHKNNFKINLLDATPYTTINVNIICHEKKLVHVFTHY